MSAVAVVGSFMADLTVRVPRRPRPGETVVGREFCLYLGGKGFNQALAAHRAGAQTRMIGCLGSDEYGDRFAAALAADRIDSTAVRRVQQAGTGVGLPVVEDDGQNAIVIVPRANMELSAADVERASGLIATASVLLLQFEVPMAASLEAARIAQQAGTLVVLNPAPMGVLSAELLSLTDVLVPNESEAATLAGLPPTADLHQVLEHLGQMWSRDLVLTAGAGGVYVRPAGRAATLIEAHRVEVASTVGAGDTLCGCLAAALANGADLIEAARFANAAAAIAVTRDGSQDAPTREEILQQLHQPVRETAGREATGPR